MTEPQPPANPGLPPLWAVPSACQRLDQYLLGPELGRGGMARVLEAWDTLLRRRVAIKLLHTSDPMQTVRFFREAQAQARLEHPNICRILELGNDMERPYLVLPLIQGRTLGDLRPELDTAAIVRIIADVAAAIHFAHRSGLIHRDLKPHNILVEALPDGAWRPIVVDFGLARDFTVQDQTLTWAMVGTPAFMSPEQARGHHPTPAADIYSLGATQFALLTGGPPFEATTVAGLLTQQDRREAPPARKLSPGVPRDLETITLKCLETDPARRYPNAFELEQDLRRFLAGEPIKARPATWFGRSWRRFRRNRPLAASILIGLLAAGGLLGWNLRTRIQAGRQVAMAQRFGMEVRELEAMLRVERMLPAHDMRQVEGRIRTRLDTLKASMAVLKRVAIGPGNHALGSGQLALRDYPGAQRHFETAWQAGFHASETAYGLGVAHFEQYLQAQDGLRQAKPADRPALLATLEREHRQPARAHFALAQGTGLESPALALARMAFMDNRFPACAEHCRQALAAEPWRYEALILEAEAWRNEAYRLQEAGKASGPVCALLKDRALAALDRARDLARSDIGIHRAQLDCLALLAVLESEGGQPSLAAFAKADAIFQEACRIQPANGELWRGMMNNSVRELFLRLTRGEDVRARCRELIAQQHQLKNLDTLPRLVGYELSVELWILGEAQWRRGEDPTRALEAALAGNHGQGIDEAETLNVLAKHRAQQGLDPRPQLEAALRIAQEEIAKRPPFFYNHTVPAESLLILAQWQWQTGADPRASLARGLDKARAAVARKPDAVYPYFHLPLLLSLQAQAAMARGQDPGAAIHEAVKAGRMAVKIRPDHYRGYLGLAEAYLVQGQDRARRGLDPGSSWQEAEGALNLGLRNNPTDWRLALTEARLALARTDWAERAGGAVESWLERTDRAASHGLEVKADAAELLWARAEVQRLRWRRNRQPGPRMGAEQLARKALALWPGFQAAKALLREVQG